MPLPKRSIEPVYVSRSAYQQDEIQLIELETVTNTTLTNIIRQLSSLSKHAEDIFGELARDVGNISNRANSLQARIDHLSIKVTQLDSTMDDVPLTDITRKKGFRSTKIFDQKIFSHSTMPAPMLETYTMCDKPPPLNKLNSYRDDGKDGLKFYTDPNYFFDLWRQEMLKDTERVMNDKGKKLNRLRQDCGNSSVTIIASKKRVRKPHNTREKQRLIAIGQGETLMSNNINYHTPNSINSMDTGYGNMGICEQHRPDSIDLHNVCNSDQEITGFRGHFAQVATSITATVGTVGTNTSTMENNESFTINCKQDVKETIPNFYHNEVLNENQQCFEQAETLPSEGSSSPLITSRIKIRPSQPPPAPPSSGSRNGTPGSSKANTPTRRRNSSSNRDILPPPPPLPESIMTSTSPPRTIAAINGNTSRQLSNSSSRTCKPSISSHTDNNFGNVNISSPSQQPNYHLLSSTEHEEQNFIKSSVDKAPPPPPPPPPLSHRELMQQGIQMELKCVINGDMHRRNFTDGTAQNTIGQKRLLPPFYDSRTDLMKAIRDGITLRKVEKSEQKEIERNTALHDVASILARRVAIELSESEESDSDDSEGWMESIENSA